MKSVCAREITDAGNCCVQPAIPLVPNCERQIIRCQIKGMVTVKITTGHIANKLKGN